MKGLAVFSLLLLGCSSGGNGKSGAHAALQVTFGAAAPANLDTDVVSNSTSSRLMMQSSDTHITVFVSLATPLQAQQITLSTDAQVVSIWAKQDATLPLIATSGSLQVDSSTGMLNFVFTDVAKPADSTGTSLLISGSMTGVSPPP